MVRASPISAATSSSSAPASGWSLTPHTAPTAKLRSPAPETSSERAWGTPLEMPSRGQAQRGLSPPVEVSIATGRPTRGHWWPGLAGAGSYFHTLPTSAAMARAASPTASSVRGQEDVGPLRGHAHRGPSATSDAGATSGPSYFHTLPTLPAPASETGAGANPSPAARGQEDVGPLRGHAHRGPSATSDAGATSGPSYFHTLPTSAVMARPALPSSARGEEDVGPLRGHAHRGPSSSTVVREGAATVDDLGYSQRAPCTITSGLQASKQGGLEIHGERGRVGGGGKRQTRDDHQTASL